MNEIPKLPNELWETILYKLRSITNIKKLYHALPNDTLNTDIHNKHINNISFNMLVGDTYLNMLYMFLNNDLKIKLDYNSQLYGNLKCVKFIKNIYIKNKNRDCIVCASENGKIIFWDAHTYELSLIMDVFLPIKYIDFHQNGKLMITITEINATFLRIKLWSFNNNGNIQTTQFRFLIMDNEMITVLFHPIFDYLYIVVYDRMTRQICNLYIWKYIFSDITPENEHECLSLIYLQNADENFSYYLPIKIDNNGYITCIITDLHYSYFCKLYIIDTQDEKYAKHISKDKVVISHRKINDFICIDDKIYYHIKNPLKTKEYIYEQLDDKIRPIYKFRSIKLSNLYFKNNFLVFMDDSKIVKLDLESNENEILIDVKKYTKNMILYDIN